MLGCKKSVTKALAAILRRTQVGAKLVDINGETSSL